MRGARTAVTGLTQTASQRKSFLVTFFQKSNCLT
jgi:hypothetical protein